MSTNLQFRLTSAGQAAAWNASNTGIALELTHVQFGSGNRAPTGTETALVTPRAYAAIAAGNRVAPNQIRLSAMLTGLSSFNIAEIGIWKGVPGQPGSVLFAYWSQASGVLGAKAPGVDFIFTHDMVLSDAVAAGAVTVVADTSQSAMLAMLAEHEAKPDPHVGYMLESVLELTTVPAQKIAPIICVTQPYFRMMVWDGSQYVSPPIVSPNLTGEPTAPTAAPGTNTKQIANTEFVITEVTTAVSGMGYGLFYKADPTTVAFTKTGAGTASIKAGTKVYVAGTIVQFSSATAITMPTLTAGTDYAIWVKDDATIQATTDFSSAPGAGNWRKIGGFHYAPGGNANAQAGGDTTPAINAYSFWDVKFRPACPDPRGMTLVDDSFWADIYLLGVDHLTNGTSKYNVSIADGSAPPKIPTKFGGTGSNAYSTLTWWDANEVLQSWGKRSPTYDEFAALAYGTTEATGSGGSDVPTTGVSGTGATKAWNTFTSRWGVIQATGCMWIRGGEFGGGAAGASWTANTGGRGSTYQMENAVLLGGAWSDTTQSGSRCSDWRRSPTYSNNDVGARGVCGHYVAD